MCQWRTQVSCDRDHARVTGQPSPVRSILLRGVTLPRLPNEQQAILSSQIRLVCRKASLVGGQARGLSGHMVFVVVVDAPARGRKQ